MFHNSSSLALPAGYFQCRLRPIVALFARSYLVLFNFCFCFAYNFPAHFPSFLQCWPHDFNYLRMEAFLQGGEEKRRGKEGKEARLVLCSLFMAASFDKGSECSGLHSRLHCRVTLLKPRLALQLFRLLAIFGFVAVEESGRGVRRCGRGSQ